MNTSWGPENHPSGDLKIHRKCCNGTNRHSAFNPMMITKPSKWKIIVKIMICGGPELKESARLLMQHDK